MKKLNKFYFVLIVVFTFISCKNQKGYTITGNIKNAENTKVYLEDVFGDAPATIDTATILNNKFTLKNYSKKGIYRLRFGDNIDYSIFLFIEEKDNINVIADVNELNAYKVEGSVESKSIQELMSTSKKNFTSLNAIATELQIATPKTKDSLQILMDLGEKNHVDYIKNFIDKESNNDVACFAINFFGPSMQKEIPYLISVTEKLHKAEPTSNLVTNTFKQFQLYRAQLMAEADGGIALNTQAPNIVLSTPNGDTIQLKNLQGNYVLLDFWASWCQPCRMENPNVVALYNQYHAKGFEVFSVSLDANKDQWIKAIAKDEMVWKNHGSDLGGWNSAPAQLYNIKSIPSTFLLDKKGKIIAKDLRGEELKAKLAELFPG